MIVGAFSFMLPDMAISDNGDTKTYQNGLGEAKEAVGVVVVNGDTMTYTNSMGHPKEAIGVVVLGGEGGTGAIVPGGVLDSTDDLPTDGNTTGDSFLIDGSLWVWNGTEWTGPVTVGGPQGPSGPSGPAGPQGPAGETGPAGPEGPRGPEGIQGSPGTQGEQGIPGTDGPEGPEGPMGSLVTPNDHGTLDEDRIAFIQGQTPPYFFLVDPDGDMRVNQTVPTGIAGDQSLHLIGWNGSYWSDYGQLTGAQGPRGIQGVPGEQGPAGTEGPQGEQGPAGADGAQGPEGPEGPQGETGSGGRTLLYEQDFVQEDSTLYAEVIFDPDQFHTIEVEAFDIRPSNTAYLYTELLMGGVWQVGGYKSSVYGSIGSNSYSTQTNQNRIMSSIQIPLQDGAWSANYRLPTNPLAVGKGYGYRSDESTLGRPKDMMFRAPQGVGPIEGIRLFWRDGTLNRAFRAGRIEMYGVG